MPQGRNHGKSTPVEHVKRMMSKGTTLAVVHEREAVAVSHPAAHWSHASRPSGTIVDQGAQPAVRLTDRETTELKECEQILERGLGTFFEVGNALLQIRESHLYRATHRTFEQYCHERWNMGRSYAWRLIGAAERMNLLPEDTTFPRPINEFQIRPFLKLAPKEFPSAWKQVVKTAKEGKVTPRVVQVVVRKLLPTGSAHSPGFGKKKRRNLQSKTLGEILVLLHDARRRVEKGETEEAVAALERIERVLCGPA